MKYTYMQGINWKNGSFTCMCGRYIYVFVGILYVCRCQNGNSLTFSNFQYLCIYENKFPKRLSFWHFIHFVLCHCTYHDSIYIFFVQFGTFSQLIIKCVIWKLQVKKYYYKIIIFLWTTVYGDSNVGFVFCLFLSMGIIVLIFRIDYELHSTIFKNTQKSQIKIFF